jgi:hypothetical protein
MVTRRFSKFYRVPSIPLSFPGRSRKPGYDPELAGPLEGMLPDRWRAEPLPDGSSKFALDSCSIKASRIILGARIDQPHQAAIKELAEKISVAVIKTQLVKKPFKIEFNAPPRCSQ